MNFILLFILFACEQNVVFQKPLPPDVKPITSIPLDYVGVYYCESDSTLVYVDNHMIYSEEYVDFVTSIKLVKETEGCAIVDDELYIEGRNECVSFEYIGSDRIRATLRDVDTLFNFTDQQVAKLYQGKLYLNFQDDKDRWMTQILTLEKDGSVLWETTDIEDSQKSVEKVAVDYQVVYDSDSTTIYIVNPTLREFEKLLSRGKTRECDRFIPFNLEDPF